MIKDQKGISCITLKGGEKRIIKTNSSGNITTTHKIVKSLNHAIENNIKFIKIGSINIEVDKVWLVQDIETKNEFVINEFNSVESIDISKMSDDKLKDALFTCLADMEDDELNGIMELLLDELFDRYNKLK